MPRTPFVPPRPIVTAAWKVHRAIARRGPGRGLWEPGQRNAWGALSLTTLGRRSGRERTVILGYLPDGVRWHTLAMNGWGEGHPDWWLNVRARPEATITLSDGSTHAVLTHRAEGDEHRRLWGAWVALEPAIVELAARRSTPTEVAVLTPVR
ncbi:nitroreductase family deazaflavin-dependent oxidoreductase [Ruania alkalisoli]|uniref:Nitroreductase family deazaflavin-dependent oxidoreductase n=1 Tax=Ruania alkalisoli TaxID=2779775 RepID=A0A7M1SSP6_9MICO|nr:nitroreductase/quinone reductase family protein [Ruania alkalisoli]QOR70576.1 nitroreductase family deazaflavin-dependent oxidoreductase [Ruania alkalisoli]